MTMMIDDMLSKLKMFLLVFDLIVLLMIFSCLYQIINLMCDLKTMNTVHWKVMETLKVDIVKLTSGVNEKIPLWNEMYMPKS